MIPASWLEGNVEDAAARLAGISKRADIGSTLSGAKDYLANAAQGLGDRAGAALSSAAAPIAGGLSGIKDSISNGAQGLADKATGAWNATPEEFRPIVGGALLGGVAGGGLGAGLGVFGKRRKSPLATGLTGALSGAAIGTGIGGLASIAQHGIPWGDPKRIGAVENESANEFRASSTVNQLTGKIMGAPGSKNVGIDEIAGQGVGRVGRSIAGAIAPGGTPDKTRMLTTGVGAGIGLGHAAVGGLNDAMKHRYNAFMAGADTLVPASTSPANYTPDQKLIADTRARASDAFARQRHEFGTHAAIPGVGRRVPLPKWMWDPSSPKAMPTPFMPNIAGGATIGQVMDDRLASGNLTSNAVQNAIRAGEKTVTRPGAGAAIGKGLKRFGGWTGAGLAVPSLYRAFMAARNSQPLPEGAAPQ